MTKKIIKKLSKYAIFTTIFLILFIPHTKAQQPNNDFAIIPEATNPTQVKDAVQKIGSEGGSVMENYRDVAYGPKDAQGNRPGTSELKLGDQLASGVMNRDTLLDYVTYIVRFLLQLGLVIGAFTMIYIGYEKITEFRDFKGGKIKFIIIGLAVITFAYVIIKTIVSMFLS